MEEILIPQEIETPISVNKDTKESPEVDCQLTDFWLNFIYEG